MIRNPKYIYGQTDITVPASIHLGEFILKRICENKHKVALINGITDERLTYGEILQESINFSVSLTRLGIRKGDVVGVVSENRREFWSTAVGAICAGATVTPINLTYTKDEFQHVINITKPKTIVCSPISYKLHGKTFKSLPYIKNIILYGEERQANVHLYNDLATMIDDGRRSKLALKNSVSIDDFLPVDVDGQSDVVCVLYSSGTTGLPKGVMLTHLNIIVMTSSTHTIVKELISLTITPWFHALGLVATLTGFMRGRTSVYLPKFEVDLYLKTIEKYKVGRIHAVPAMLIALSKSEHSYDTSSLEIVHCGAAPLYEETALAVKRRFPSVEALHQGYGMTESTLAVTMNMSMDKIGSVGLIASHTIIKVVDQDTKEPLGPNKQGELCIKGPTIMKGYVGKDRKADFDEEGFYKSGDVGYYDEEGYFYIVDRLKELIKYKGYQVAPAEIETILLKNEGVKDVGVVGVAHPTAGEVPLAFVVLQPDAKLTEKDIENYVAERLSNPKRLRGGVRFIPEIPKNQTGKILRRELRKMIKSKSKL